MDITKQILRLNYAGLPIGWVSYQTAVRLYCNNQVTYECGNSSLLIRGGSNKMSGNQSTIVINSIVATKNYNKISSTNKHHALQKRCLNMFILRGILLFKKFI
jgi:hypothetical protein